MCKAGERQKSVEKRHTVKITMRSPWPIHIQRYTRRIHETSTIGMFSKKTYATCIDAFSKRVDVCFVFYHDVHAPCLGFQSVLLPLTFPIWNTRGGKRFKVVFIPCCPYSGAKPSSNMCTKRKCWACTFKNVFFLHLFVDSLSRSTRHVAHIPCCFQIRRGGLFKRCHKVIGIMFRKNHGRLDDNDIIERSINAG